MEAQTTPEALEAQIVVPRTAYKAQRAAYENSYDAFDAGVAEEEMERLKQEIKALVAEKERLQQTPEKEG